MRVALLAAAALATAPSALAAAPSGPRATLAQVSSLASRAPSDPAALARLRAIGFAGGERVGLAAALDVRGAPLTDRLAVLAAAGRGAGAAPSPAAARADAQAIVSGRRFTGSGVPQPLRRPLGWLGRLLHDIGHWIGHLGHGIAVHLPGGGLTLEGLFAAFVVGVTVFALVGLTRRRGRRAVEAEPAAPRRAGEDARLLEREADAAERAGAYEHALRLRFRAGLLRLEQAGRVSARRSLTNGEIARELGSSSFELVSRDFDQVVYGRRGASAEAAARARREWEHVLAEARRQ